ncbi:MAG: cytochrome c, partial [Verrucomicrobia bacterium]|nr:cytochrome c [Verrucomicrobiota bacterium]
MSMCQDLARFPTLLPPWIRPAVPIDLEQPHIVLSSSCSGMNTGLESNKLVGIIVDERASRPDSERLFEMKRLLNSQALSRRGCAWWIGVFLLLQTPIVEAAAPDTRLATQLERGREAYIRNCFVCHQLSGQGVPGAFPPLARADYLT